MCKTIFAYEVLLYTLFTGWVGRLYTVHTHAHWQPSNNISGLQTVDARKKKNTHFKTKVFCLILLEEGSVYFILKMDKQYG